jgi:hypothetical protein
VIDTSLAQQPAQSTMRDYRQTMREAKAALQRADHDMQLSRRRPEPLATELRIHAYQEIGHVKALLEETQRSIRTEQAGGEA